ncbi:MAG: hypothetical protein QOK16_839 [Solirubrobacteraceae bacterium]|jgi:hypothetical protein|nr:hypothetical protein [Solirubrobacteraceae bacterium]
MPYVTVQILCAGETFEVEVDSEADMKALAEKLERDIADEEVGLIDPSAPGEPRLALVEQPGGIIPASAFELIKVPPPPPREPSKRPRKVKPAP